MLVNHSVYKLCFHRVWINTSRTYLWAAAGFFYLFIHGQNLILLNKYTLWLIYMYIYESSRRVCHMYMHVHTLDNDFYFNLSCSVHAAGICFCMKIWWIVSLVLTEWWGPDYCELRYISMACSEDHSDSQDWARLRLYPQALHLLPLRRCSTPRTSK